MIDNPGVFSSMVDNDLYVNPWWALRKRIHPRAAAFVACMDQAMGPPDLWFQGLFHELLWGPRDLPRGWRPSFHANLSGHNGELWNTFWLPWRAGDGVEETFWTDRDGKRYPFAANVSDFNIRFDVDVIRMHGYIDSFPRIREFIGGEK